MRDKIERRYADALGRAELASGSVEVRMLEVRHSALDMAGNARLQEIRAAMSGKETKALPDNPVAARMDEIRAAVAKEHGQP